MIIEIEGTIITNGANNATWGADFIAWLESRGETFAGTTKLNN